jgi:trigger factor
VRETVDSKLEYISETKAKVIVRISNHEILPRFVEALEKANIMSGANGLVGIKNQFSEYVKRDLCNQFVKNYFPQALKSHNLSPLSAVQFTQREWDEKADFEFSASFEIKPKISSINWTGIEAVIDYSPVFATDEMVKNALNALTVQKQKVTICPRTTTAQIGLFAVVDIDATYQGKIFLPSQTRGLRVNISAANAQAPLQAGLIGKKVGDEFSFQYLFPTSHLEKQMAGKEIQFKVRLIELQTISKPEMTDDFVVELFSEALNSESGPKGSVPRTVVELSHKIKHELEFNLAHQKFQVNRQQVFKFLLSKNKFKVPVALAQEQFQMLISLETKDFLKKHSQQELVAHLKGKQEFFQRTSEELVQIALIVEAIAVQLNLKCETRDFEVYFERMSRIQGVKIEFIKKSFQNPKMRSHLAYTIVEDKVVEHLIELSRGHAKAG